MTALDERRAGDAPSISVVSPIYNNAGSISQLVHRVIETRNSGFPDHLLEIVLVDDGSTDGSLDEIRGLLSHRVQGVTIKMVRLSRNFGQVSAIVAGVSMSTGDATIVISADLQDPPELMTRMVDEWKLGTEVVVAARKEREDGALASVFSKLSYGVARRRYAEMPRGGFDYFLLSRRAAMQFVSKPGRKRFLQGEVFELGYRRKVLEYERMKRATGKSQWRFWKRVEYFVDLLLSSSNLPIRSATFVGFLSVLGSIIYGVIVVVARITGSVPIIGLTPVILLTLFFGGLTVLLLGLIGEYIWRMYEEVSGKRQFLVESTEESPK